MIHNLFTLSFLFVITGSQCNKTDTIPKCINAKIAEIKAQPKWNPPAKVSEYEYQGKTVYYFTSNCCDQYNVVYDSNCNYICAPSGGLSGQGDGKCKDFNAEAKLVKVIWEDER